MFRLRRINFSRKLFFLLHIYSVKKYNFPCLQREFDPPTNTFFEANGPVQADPDSSTPPQRPIDLFIKTLLNSAFSWETCERSPGPEFVTSWPPRVFALKEFCPADAHTMSKSWSGAALTGPAGTFSHLWAVMLHAERCVATFKPVKTPQRFILGSLYQSCSHEVYSSPPASFHRLWAIKHGMYAS